MVRQQVLAEDKQTIFHWRSLKVAGGLRGLALDRSVWVVAPLAPGAGVGFYPWIAEQLGDQVGKARAVVGLAVGDDFFVGGDAEAIELCLDVPTNAQRSGWVHACSPFKVDGAGYVPGFLRQDFLAVVLAGCAGIPDGQIGSAEAALQVFAGRSRR